MGQLNAYDARNGTRLWSAPSQAGIVAARSTYEVNGGAIRRGRHGLGWRVCERGGRGRAEEARTDEYAACACVLAEGEGQASQHNRNPPQSWRLRLPTRHPPTSSQKAKRSSIPTAPIVTATQPSVADSFPTCATPPRFRTLSSGDASCSTGNCRTLEWCPSLQSSALKTSKQSAATSSPEAKNHKPKPGRHRPRTDTVSATLTSPAAAAPVTDSSRCKPSTAPRG